MLSVVATSARWGIVLVDPLIFFGVGSRVTSGSVVTDDGEVKITLKV